MQLNNFHQLTAETACGLEYAKYRQGFYEINNVEIKGNYCQILPICRSLIFICSSEIFICLTGGSLLFAVKFEHAKSRSIIGFGKACRGGLGRRFLTVHAGILV